MAYTLLTSLCLIVVLCITGIHGQGRGCCMPKQSETQAGMKVITAKKDIVNIYLPRLSVDYTKKMISMEEIVYGEQLYNVTSYCDYTRGKIFVVMGKKCYKMPLVPREMEGPCIPKDAKYEGRIRLGYGQSSMNLDTYVFNRKSEQGEIESRLQVSSEGCIPTMEYIGVKNGDKFETSDILYFNYNPTIRDPSVFDIPRICDKADSVDPSMMSGMSMMSKFTK